MKNEPLNVFERNSTSPHSEIYSEKMGLVNKVAALHVSLMSQNHFESKEIKWFKSKIIDVGAKIIAFPVYLFMKIKKEGFKTLSNQFADRVNVTLDIESALHTFQKRYPDEDMEAIQKEIAKAIEILQEKQGT